ncbi:hypothetical protein N7474_007828 [Penicillium riverlandense]|uniref:uncharacterized protein n=1 Tax=Penicillium riverlandense TaxID=1903569 RepID=UPI002546A64C|nr:uncharacterized protein N7474_007828 [Penicillium riverlandense]KAJ5811527.1 hypothetical protein N7474_007828 [Penicillium riverlandense]
MQHSFFVHGQRVFFSGEFHPFRLPAPGLWLDVFQKMKSIGFNGVSFYVNWALLEGKEGEFEAEGVFALEPFLKLRKQQVYISLHARVHTSMLNIGSIIAKAQITNGGPVILLQPENEYSSGNPPFPDPIYFKAVEDQYRDAGIVIPFISNDNSPHGYFYDQGPPKWPVYGHDSYPKGFDDDIYQWPANALPTDYGELHEEMAPDTPYSVMEFQGGSWDPWGGYGYNKTAARLGPPYQRIFFKNIYSFGATVFNVYMGAGGTNWGNLGYPEGYTSYDYGAPITELRTVERENYSELKLQAMFLHSSPEYLSAVPQNNSHANGSYTGNTNIATTALFGNTTNFFVLRHAEYDSQTTEKYQISLLTSKGNTTIPQLGGSLSLVGRDSKFHVTDYDIAGLNLLYSTAEIFTWRLFGDKRVLIVYGGPGEVHELAIEQGGKPVVVEGSKDSVKFDNKSDSTVIQYTVGETRTIVMLSSGLYVYLMVSGNFTNPTTFFASPIVKAGYLVRTVKVDKDNVYLTGDFNATTDVEIIGANKATKSLFVNSKSTVFQQDRHGVIKAVSNFVTPSFSLPNLSKIDWKVLDSLPEIQPDYDDSMWTAASLTTSNNTERNLTTPVSLYASDYGYNTGYLLYRGKFRANGNEKLFLETQGGSAYGHSIWVNDKFVGSFSGAITAYSMNQTWDLPTNNGQTYVITVLIDQMGFEENGSAGTSDMKTPRGILDYSLSGHNKSDISWKLTGNLGGEDYQDHTRGPLNEGEPTLEVLYSTLVEALGSGPVTAKHFGTLKEGCSPNDKVTIYPKHQQAHGTALHPAQWQD